MKRAKQRTAKRAAEAEAAEAARSFEDGIAAMHAAASACVPVLNRFAEDLRRTALALRNLRETMPPWHMGLVAE
jgi:hypothetical protein